MSDVILPADTEHPVRAAQNRIAQAFAVRRQALPGVAKAGIGGYLIPTLDACGWQGTPRNIAEAMPHDTLIESVDMLRAVLCRLGIETAQTELSARQIRAEHCPCIVTDRWNRLHLVTDVEPRGKLVVYCPETQGSKTLKAWKVRGSVYRARLIDNAQRQEAIQRDGFIWPVLRSFRSRFVAIFWQSFVISLIGLAVSLYVMYVYDKAIGTQSLDTLAMLAIGALIGLGVELSLRHRRARDIAWIAARFDALVASGTLKSVLNLPLPMSEGAPLNAQLTRFRQFEVGRELFGGSLATALIDLPFTLIFFALIFVLGGTLGLVPVALAVILAVMGLLTDPVAARQTREMGEWKSKSEALLVEITTRMRTIRDDNAEQIWIERSSDVYRRYLNARFRSLQFSGSLQTVAQMLVSAAGVGVLGLGAVEVMRGQLTVGSLVAIMAVVWRVLGPIQTVFLSLHRVKMMGQTIRQIEQLMKMKPERPASRVPISEQRLNGALSLTNVCLRYGMRPDLALKAVSLTVAPGEFITVTGSSGAGKSTLLKSIIGLYPIQTGAVRFDDLDLRQLDPAETRQSVGYLPQEPALFFGTVAQNLRLVAPDATDDELREALRAMGIEADNPGLPNGIDTRMSAAVRQSLSLAMIQRIALARMFVRSWPILLFDEPSTHLDREGDEALMAAIARIKGRSTIVMVTARPSHMRMSDRVIVMHDGQVVGQGTPDDIVPFLMSQASKPASAKG